MKSQVYWQAYKVYSILYYILKYKRMDAASSSDVQQKLKGMESELQLLKLANQQLMEENQVLSMQMEAVLQENTTKIEV